MEAIINKKLRVFYQNVFSKYLGNPTVVAIKEFIEDNFDDEKQISEFVDIAIRDGLIQHEKEEIFLAEKSEVEDFEFIDDIDISSLKVKDEKSEYTDRVVKIDKEDLLEDEENLIEFISNSILKNELEYVSLYELIHFFEECSTQATKNKLKMFFERLSDIIDGKV